MLDPRLLREQPDVVRRALQARGSNAPIEALLDQDARRLRVLRGLLRALRVFSGSREEGEINAESAEEPRGTRRGQKDWEERGGA